MPRDQLKPSQAAELLERMVADRSPGLRGLSPQTALEVWLAFAEVEFALPPDADADGLLYQFGLFAFPDRRFHLDLVRQFSTDGDEYLQVHLDVQFLPDDSLSGLGSYHDWWWPNRGLVLTEWANRLRSRPEWSVLTQRFPASVRIHQDET